MHTISKCLLKLSYINLIRDLIRGHRPVTTKTTGEQWTAPAAYWVCIRGKTFPCKSSHSSLSVSHAFTCTRMQTHNAHTDSRKQARLLTELKHAACMMNVFFKKALKQPLLHPVLPCLSHSPLQLKSVCLCFCILKVSLLISISQVSPGVFVLPSRHCLRSTLPSSHLSQTCEISEYDFDLIMGLKRGKCSFKKFSYRGRTTET